jgi:hypothetical protein
MQRLSQAFAVVERILRDRTAHFSEIGSSQDLASKISDMLIVSLLGMGLFGAAMGLIGGLPWMLASMVKLPLLFLASISLCLPTLYYFSLLFGSRLTFSQTIAILLTALTVTSVLSLGFSFISLFFRFSGSNYAFMVVLDVLMLAVAGSAGLIFLVQGVLYLEQSAPPAHVSIWHWLRFFVIGGVRSLILVSWIWLFGIVGTQMGWTLRPFFGAPGTSFVLMRPVGSNFYQEFFYILRQLLTGG